jgi:hypothetical protein
LLCERIRFKSVKLLAITLPDRNLCVKQNWQKATALVPYMGGALLIILFLLSYLQAIIS